MSSQWIFSIFIFILFFWGFYVQQSSSVLSREEGGVGQFLTWDEHVKKSQEKQTPHLRQELKLTKTPKSLREKRSNRKEVNEREHYQNFKFKSSAKIKNTTEIQSPLIKKVPKKPPRDILVSIFYGNSNQLNQNIKSDRIGQFTEIGDSPQNYDQFPKGAVLIPPPNKPIVSPSPWNSKESIEEEEIPSGAVLIPPPMEPLFNPYDDAVNVPIPKGSVLIPSRTIPKWIPPTVPGSKVQEGDTDQNLVLPEVKSLEKAQVKSDNKFELPKGAILIPPRRNPIYKPPPPTPPVPKYSDYNYHAPPINQPLDPAPDFGHEMQMQHQKDPGISQVENKFELPAGENPIQNYAVTPEEMYPSIREQNQQLILMPMPPPIDAWAPSFTNTEIEEPLDPLKIPVNYGNSTAPLMTSPFDPNYPPPVWSSVAPPTNLDGVNPLIPYQTHYHETHNYHHYHNGLKSYWWNLKRAAHEHPLLYITTAGLVALKLIHKIEYIHHIKKHGFNPNTPLGNFTLGLKKIYNNLQNSTGAAPAMRNPLAFLPVLTTSAALAIISVGVFMRFIVGGPLMSLIFMYLTMIMSPGLLRAMDTVHKIDIIVPLTTYGKLVTGMRAFLGMSTTEHLPILGGVLVYNREISQNAANFLRTNPDIHTYITPSIKETKVRKKQKNDSEPWWCRLPGFGALLARVVSGSGCSGANSDSYTKFVGTYSPHKDSYVNLTSFYSDPKARADKTEILGDYQVFCGDKKKVIKSKKKLNNKEFCTNAIALGQRSERSGANSYYFDLKDGNDTAVGRRGFRNTFLVENGYKFYQGQDQDDTFILLRSGVTGVLDGGGGDNILIFGEDYEKNKFVNLNLTTKSGYSTLGQSTGDLLLLYNFNGVKGRQDLGEKFIVGCKTKFIEGQSGKSLQVSDVIEIPEVERSNSNCVYNTTFKLSRFTKLFNYALQGNFTYNFPSSPSEAKGIELNIFGLERMNFDPRGRHKILLNWKLNQMTSLNFQPGPGIFTMRANDSGFVLRTKVIQSEGDQQPTFYTMLEDHTTQEAEIKVTPWGDLQILHTLDTTANKISRERQAFPSVSNIFIISGGHWLLRGGHLNDGFDLHDKFTGYIDGGSGHNLLTLAPEFLTKNKTKNGHVEIDLRKSYLTYNSSPAVRVTVENIQNIVGRPRASEDIIVNCDTIEVDAKGGFSGREPDVIQILNDKCAYNFTVVIHDETIVRNFATRGEFFYKIEKRGVFDVESKFPPKTIHNYILSSKFQDIKSAIFDTNTNRLSFQFRDQHDSAPFHTGHWVKFSKDGKELYHTAPNIFTQDGVQFKAKKSDGDLVAFVKFQNQDSAPFKGLNGIHHLFDLDNVTGLDIQGGDFDDTFLIHKNVTGILNGMGGDNTLRLVSLDLDHVYVDLAHGHVILHEDDKGGLSVQNFSNFYGRQGKNDTIVVGCQTKFVSGEGGHDKIIVNDMSMCPDQNEGHDLKMEFVIPSPSSTSKGTTRVLNLAGAGTFIYNLDGHVPFQVETKTEEEEEAGDLNLSQAQHIYQYNFKVEDIERIKFVHDKKRILFWVKGHISWHTFFTIDGDESQFYNQPKFMTTDDVQISVLKETKKIFLSFSDNSKDGQLVAHKIVKEYEVIASKLNVSMILVSEEGEHVLLEEGGPLKKVFDGNL